MPVGMNMPLSELAQTRTPLLAAMAKYVHDGVVPFHTPGHKQGKGIHSRFEKMIGKTALALDLAVMNELDNLHEPHGCIQEAQGLAADLYGADHSFFVVNGTTGGIHAMIMTVAGPDEKIIIPRNVHRSVSGGIILSGAVPVYMQPEIDADLGITMGITHETVECTLRRHPDAKAVLLINPTYYGVASDLRKIVELVHSYDMPVIVDEAHGSHLLFHPDLPVQAMDAGADICAQSTHKLLGALTQCSMVHCREGRINILRLKAMLQLVQSTSPNYLLMASLDAARMQMATDGARLLARTVAKAHRLRKEINAIPGLYCFGEEKEGHPGIYKIDPTKITVNVKGLQITGIEAEQILRHKYKIQAELSDMYNVLFLLTIGDSEGEVDALVHALSALATEARSRKESVNWSFESNWGGISMPEVVISPREALFGATRTVALAQAENRICCEIITVYPPGIPILCPGERITKEIIQQCLDCKNAGLYISGAADASLQTIQVQTDC